jgi:hypothetical protein
VNNNKSIDVCDIYQAFHRENYDHGVRNDLHYTNHRQGAWDILDSKFDSRKDKLPYQEYINVLYNSKVAISPFGMGELCFRDFECMQFGTVIIKPSVEKVKTLPNFYVDGETYFSVNPDWSDLNEKVDYILSNFNEINEKVNYKMRERYSIQYDYRKLCQHWYDIFKNLNSVKVEGNNEL